MKTKQKHGGTATLSAPTGTGSVSTMKAARMCGVSVFSIQRWFDQGILTGSTLPGGRRRISSTSLETFMKKHIVPGSGSDIAGSIRVLLVDDDAKLLGVMKETLEAAGKMEVRAASSGLEAGLAVQEFRPDVMILDVLLEDVPGPLIVKRIRESQAGRQMRIVAISGKASDAEQREIMAAGANGFLRKPFRMAELVKAVTQRSVKA